MLHSVLHPACSEKLGARRSVGVPLLDPVPLLPTPTSPSPALTPHPNPTRLTRTPQGNVGTAAYLNVFGSIFRVLKELKSQGYDVGPIPNNETELIQSVLQSKEAKYNSADLNVAYRMKVGGGCGPQGRGQGCGEGGTGSSMAWHHDGITRRASRRARAPNEPGPTTSADDASPPQPRCPATVCKAQPRCSLSWPPLASPSSPLPSCKTAAAQMLACRACCNPSAHPQVDEYQKLCEYSESLEENWGKPPGQLNSNGQELLVFGKQYGNVFIGVQVRARVGAGGYGCGEGSSAARYAGGVITCCWCVEGKETRKLIIISLTLDTTKIKHFVSCLHT